MLLDCVRARRASVKQKTFNAGPFSRVSPVYIRLSDEDIFAKLVAIVDRSRSKRFYGPSRAIQEMTLALRISKQLTVYYWRVPKSPLEAVPDQKSFLKAVYYPAESQLNT